MKAIILAGGSGSRLWPLSNDENPKQLLAVDSDLSLLQNTFLRAMDFSAPDEIITVTNVKFREKTFNQLKLFTPNPKIICEPCARNTAPAIACALEYLLKSGADDIVTILPADHLIREKQKFAHSISCAAQLAEKNYIVTLGIRPAYPETGFGYIKTAEPLENGFKVEKFVEKPSLTVAEQYVKSGNYFWNGGIFIGRISVFMQEFAKFAPEIYQLAAECSFSNDLIDADVFENMPKISIDYAIMEKSGKIALVKLLSDWSDLGSWQAIYDLMAKDANGNVVIGHAVLHNVRNSLIYSPNRTAAIADAENIVLVNTADITMTCSLSLSQNVKVLSEK